MDDHTQPSQRRATCLNRNRAYSSMGTVARKWLLVSKRRALCARELGGAYSACSGSRSFWALSVSVARSSRLAGAACANNVGRANRANRLHSKWCNREEMPTFQISIGTASHECEADERRGMRAGKKARADRLGRTVCTLYVG